MKPGTLGLMPAHERVGSSADVPAPAASSLEGVEVVASRFGVHANTTKIVTAEIVALASEVVAELTSVKLEGSVLDKVFDRVSEQVERSFRTVSETEQLRAGTIDYSAEQSLS